MNQNLSSYRIFYTVANTGNISKAAKELYISQPAISKSIQKLEEGVGCKLFSRSSRGVVLTDEGKLLYDHVSSAFETLTLGEEKLKRSIELGVGHLKIGVSATLCKYLLLPYLQEFIRQNPHVSISITCQSTNETLELLEDNKIDIGLVGKPDNLKNIHLYVFLVGSEELIARKQALILAKQHQIVGRFMVEECHFHGIQSAKEMSICLANYDQPLEIVGEQISLAKEFFPDAFLDGKRLFSCADTLMDEYLKIMKEIGIPSASEIPMMYFVNTIKYCLNNYGITGKKLYFPTDEAWRNSIFNSGYVAAERLYFNVPIG